MQQRKEWYKDDSFSLSITLFKDVANVHCEVYRWTPSVARKGLQVFADMQNRLADKGVRYLVTVNDNPNFSKMFGAKVLNYTEVNGKEYEVLGWAL